MPTQPSSLANNRPEHTSSTIVLQAPRRLRVALFVLVVMAVLVWIGVGTYSAKIDSGVYGSDAEYDSTVPLVVSCLFLALYLPTLLNLLLPQRLTFTAAEVTLRRYGLLRTTLPWPSIASIEKQIGKDDWSIKVRGERREITIKGGAFGWPESDLRRAWDELSARASHIRPDHSTSATPATQSPIGHEHSNA
jgi:hypothetical protein